MDYARFVQLRRPLWEAFGRALETVRRRPAELRYESLEELAVQYRQVLHDHALAAARFPGTGAARRLESLAVEGTHRLTREEREGRGALRRFVTRTFPAAFRRQLDLLGVAVGLFAAAALAGLLLALVQPGLGVAFLGPRIVAGLAEGKLWTESLTTAVPPAVSSSGIAANNMTAALTAWAGGILGGLLPLYSILLNGFLLGAVLSVTLQYSLGAALLTFITAHGLLEITLLLVCAAGGLNLGRALLAAGDRPRGEALRAAARDSVTVLIGCLPWFVLLAVVESMVSPSTAVPVGAKIVLGCALEALFLSLALQPLPPDRDELV